MTVSVRYINFFPLKSLEQGAQFSKSDTFKVSLRIYLDYTHSGLLHLWLSIVDTQTWAWFVNSLLSISLAGWPWHAAFTRALCGWLLLSELLHSIFVRSHLLPPYLFRRLSLPLFTSFLSVFFFTFCSYELLSPYIMLSLALNFDICFLITPNNISPLEPCYLYEIVQF